MLIFQNNCTAWRTPCISEIIRHWNVLRLTIPPSVCFSLAIYNLLKFQPSIETFSFYSKVLPLHIRKRICVANLTEQGPYIINQQPRYAVCSNILMST